MRYAAEYDWVPEERWLHKHLRGARCVARATSPDQQLDLVRAGVGFGFIECLTGDADPDLVRLPESPLMRFTYWLTTHEDTYAAPRVRVVLDWLADVAREVAPAYEG